MYRLKSIILSTILSLCLLLVFWQRAEAFNFNWQKTDFSKHDIPLAELHSGGVSKFGIPAVNNPQFIQANKITGIAPIEPVVVVAINKKIRAYPVRYLLWHEVVNDTITRVPIAVTYCPLANSILVFNRKVNDKILQFAASGFLRHSNLVMWDRQTESLWQQFTGKGIVGRYTGINLTQIPVKIESLQLFKKQHPLGEVMKAPRHFHRPYGTTPYPQYDHRKWPPLYNGKYAIKELRPLDRVVLVANKKAWTLAIVKKYRTIKFDDYVISWTPGQASVMDNPVLSKGKDIGNVVVLRKTKKGMIEAIYDVPYAFAVHAFYPKLEIKRLFSLPTLPYGHKALEPYISGTTIKYHYGKHHAGYVRKLNNMLINTPFIGKSLLYIILNSNGSLFNNAAQVWNHNFYWLCLNPNGSRTPTGELAKAIDKYFGSLGRFKLRFNKKALNNFGSGWTWLVKDKNGRLEIINTSNANNPLLFGKKPLLTCDIWEHAYYLDYKNERNRYLSNFWHLVDWRFVMHNYVQN